MSSYQSDAEDVELNLIPIMNLFTALIPFLLMSAVFYELSVIQITVPVQSESGAVDAPKEPDKVTLNVEMLKDKFSLSASSDVQIPTYTKIILRTANLEEDLKKLTEEANTLKTKYTKSTTAIMAPGEDIPYQDIVMTMDAIRSTRRPDGGTVLLFSSIVLSKRKS